MYLLATYYKGRHYMKNTLATLEKNPRTTIERLLENDPQLVSKHTTRQYKADLFNFENWRDGRPITKTLVEEYAAKLQAEGKAPNTINQRLAAIRWYARKIADLAVDYSGDSEMADFYAKQAARIVTVKDVKGQRPERGRHIDQGELFALMRACQSDQSSAGVRDAAIIALAWSTGLRRDEISNIKLADLVNQKEDSLDIGIIGKGGKVRVAYINDGALAALLDWLAIRGDEPGALLSTSTKAARSQAAGFQVKPSVRCWRSAANKPNSQSRLHGMTSGAPLPVIFGSPRLTA